jgi:putative FmdB family regulatory protein
MPLYDFRCAECGERFEARVASDEQPACPACGGRVCERVPSSFAGPFAITPRGREARRSDATRRAREEQRRERRAQSGGDAK